VIGSYDSVGWKLIPEVDRSESFRVLFNPCTIQAQDLSQELEGNHIPNSLTDLLIFDENQKYMFALLMTKECGPKRQLTMFGLSFWDLCAYAHHSTKVTKLIYPAFLFDFN